MVDKLIFIPLVIVNGFKFVDIDIADVSADGIKALTKLSETDKSLIDGLHSDFIEYIYTKDKEDVEISDTSVTIHWSDNYTIIVLNEEININSLIDTEIMFKTVCKDLVKKYKGDAFEKIPSEIVSKII